MIMTLNIIIEVVLILFNFILKVINLNKDVFLICFIYIFIKILLNLTKKKNHLYILFRFFSPKSLKGSLHKRVV